jgi:hypothetical protein
MFWFPDFDILVSLYFQIVMYFTIIMENTKKGSIGYACYAAITRATRHFQVLEQPAVELDRR